MYPEPGTPVSTAPPPEPPVWKDPFVQKIIWFCLCAAACLAAIFILANALSQSNIMVLILVGAVCFFFYLYREWGMPGARFSFGPNGFKIR